MNIDLLAIVFGVITFLAQLGIGWYGWRNPRPKYKLLRKSVSALFLIWGIFSAYQVLVSTGTPNQQFVAEHGMGMWLATYGGTLVVLIGVLVIVRRKYLQRVRESAAA